MANKKLTKGLAGVFGEGFKDAFADIENFQKNHPVTTEDKVLISKIKTNPYQPRKIFDQKSHKELIASISEYGIFTPVVVNKDISGFTLVVGERRLRAAKELKMVKIPAVMVDYSDQQMEEIALIENIQRENLNAIEEAQALDKLIKNHKITQKEVARIISKSRVYVTNSLRLLKLSLTIQTYVLKQKLTAGHAKVLLSLDDQKLIAKIAEKIIKEKLTVRKTEQIILGYKLNQMSRNKVKKIKDDKYYYAESLLRRKIKTRIKITQKKIMIKFTNDQDLNRILEILGVIE